FTSPCSRQEWNFRHVVAVLRADPTLAGMAAQLARTHDARLTLIQTWSPSLFLYGLDGPHLLPTTAASCLLREQAADPLASVADSRLRRAVRQLQGWGPIEFWSQPGCPARIAAKASRSQKYDAVLVSHSRSLKFLYLLGVFGTARVMNANRSLFYRDTEPP